MATPPPFPWTNTDDDWFAALESGGRKYGLARRRHDGDLIEYEVLVPETGQWIFTSEGAGYFTGIGGVTNAVPITPAEATDVERALLGASRAADGTLPQFESGQPDLAERVDDLLDGFGER